MIYSFIALLCLYTCTLHVSYTLFSGMCVCGGGGGYQCDCIIILTCNCCVDSIDTTIFNTHIKVYCIFLYIDLYIGTVLCNFVV